MNKVELSLWIEESYPVTLKSIAKRKPINGIAINDAMHVTTLKIDGNPVRDPAYESWRGMLKRAYNNGVHDRQPTYRDVTVCTEWHSFSEFRKWWLENYREGWQLDKDLLVVGNREYGPDACVYVPAWLNTFTISCRSVRGEYPIGVYLHKPTGKFMSYCRNAITGKLQNLGLFSTASAAHQAWLTYKLSIAEQLKPEMNAIDGRIYQNVVTIVNQAQ